MSISILDTPNRINNSVLKSQKKFSFYVRAQQRVDQQQSNVYKLVPRVHACSTMYKCSPLLILCFWFICCKISCFEVEFMKTLLCEEQCFEFAPTFANQLTFLSTTFRNISPLTHTQNIIALIFLFNIFLQQLKENLASVIFFVSRIFIQTSYLSFFLHKCTFWAQFFST